MSTRLGQLTVSRPRNAVAGFPFAADRGPGLPRARAGAGCGTWRAPTSAAALDTLPLAQGPFDVVLAVDSAYHFATRLAFLKQAHARLRRGGRLAMTDIVRGDGAPLSAWGRVAMTHAFGLPAANRITRAEYEAQLRAVGFEDVATTVLDDRVFAGLAAFLDRHATAWHMATGALPWAPFLATAAGLRSFLTHRTMHYVLVSARRSSTR